MNVFIHESVALLGGRFRLLTSLADRRSLGPEFRSFLAPTELIEQGGVVLEARHQVRMVGRQGFVEDVKGALVERLGLGGAAGDPVELGQVV